jgi:hypothetical protein
MLPVGVTHYAVSEGVKAVKGAPDAPAATAAPALPDPSDQAAQNARLMERRAQLGLQGRMSTFLTTSQPEDPDFLGYGKSALVGAAQRNGQITKRPTILTGAPGGVSGGGMSGGGASGGGLSGGGSGYGR